MQSPKNQQSEDDQRRVNRVVAAALSLPLYLFEEVEREELLKQFECARDRSWLNDWRERECGS